MFSQVTDRHTSCANPTPQYSPRRTGHLKDLTTRWNINKGDSSDTQKAVVLILRECGPHPVRHWDTGLQTHPTAGHVHLAVQALHGMQGTHPLLPGEDIRTPPLRLVLGTPPPGLKPFDRPRGQQPLVSPPARGSHRAHAPFTSATSVPQRGRAVGILYGCTYRRSSSSSGAAAAYQSRLWGWG